MSPTTERLRTAADLAIVLLGAVLIVLTVLQQPFNQNEYVQLAPYGDADLGTAVTGTRQPPLDPFLGVLVQRLLGEGQLQQRLVPVAAGVATLALTAVLMRRYGWRWAGTWGLLFLATAPLFVRYSAYTRPYAVPMALMLLAAVVGALWLDTGRRRWLLLAFVAALLLPLSRVPEPSVFLGTAALLLVLAGLRGGRPRRRPWALAGVLLLGLTTVGTAMLLRLLAQDSTTKGTSLIELDPSAVTGRLAPAADALRDLVLPLLAQWLPWWPLTLLVVVLALALPAARRPLLGSWSWLPLVLGTLVFLAVFLLLVPVGLRDYRIRYAYFLVPPLAIALAAVVHALAARPRALRWLGPALAAALVVTQLPTTWQVLTRDDAVDLDAAGAMVAAHVPDDALVVLDGPGEAGRWRQAFFGDERFLPEGRTVVTVRALTRDGLAVSVHDGPTYLLVMDAACVSNVDCSDQPADVWDGQLPGYEEVARDQYVVLYRPTEERTGVTGLLHAMIALVDGYGAARAVPDAIVAARVMVRRGQDEEAAALLGRVCDAQPTDADLDACETAIEKRGLGEYLR